jgi:hypothetical protein
MDKVEQYKTIIKAVLNKYAWTDDDPLLEEHEEQIVTDDVHGHYFLYGVGWRESKRIHGCTIHIDLRGEKNWIQEDWTEKGVANDLKEMGVPTSDMVLAFQAPERRKHLKEFASA